MRFITMIKSDENLPAGPPPEALFTAVAEFGAEAARNGTMLDQVGLMPSSAGALVSVSGGKVTVTDGPFAEAKELIGGYAVFELRSKEEAVEITRQFMELHLEHWPGFSGVAEIRQLFDN